MQVQSRGRVYLMLVIVTLLWAGNSIVGRAVRSDIPPLTLAAARWTLALAVLAPFAWRKVVDDWPLIRSSWQTILLLGLVGVGSFNAFLYSGLRHTTATNALLIQAAIPVLVLSLDFAVHRARPRILQVAGVAITAVGVAIIIFEGDPAALLALRFGHGDALVLCAVVAWSFYTIFLRTRPAIQAVSFLALTFAVGAASMLPLAAFELRTEALHLSQAVLAAIAYVALLPSIVAYLLYNRAVEAIGAADAGQAISLQPLFGALLAALLLGEALHAYHFAGMALIVAGIALPIVTASRSEPASPSRSGRP